MKKWTDEEIHFLKEYYPNKGKMWCVEKMGLKEGQIRSKASSLGLKQNENGSFFKDWQKRAGQSKIGKKRPDQSLVMKRLHQEGKLNKTPEQCDRLRLRMIAQWKRIPHPRGMLGKKHSKSTKKIMSIKSKITWSNPNFYGNSEKNKQRLSDVATISMRKRFLEKGTCYSRGNQGWYELNNKRYYFRSSWEVNYSRYLQWLLDREDIKSWEYEPDVFWFNNIKRGVRSYLPDFKITNNNETIEYHEVKGWMDPKSITKIKRMAKYYPNIKLIIIGKEEYNAVSKFEKLFPDATREPKLTQDKYLIYKR